MRSNNVGLVQKRRGRSNIDQVQRGPDAVDVLVEDIAPRHKSSSAIFTVETKIEPTPIVVFTLRTTMFGGNRYREPFACSEPKITDESIPLTLDSSADVVVDWLPNTALAWPALNDCQSIIALEIRG